MAHQVSLYLEFSRGEYWSGLLFPAPGDLPDPGIEPMSPASPALAGRFFTTEPLEDPMNDFALSKPAKERLRAFILCWF